jgi:hypothetical protein
MDNKLVRYSKHKTGVPRSELDPETWQGLVWRIVRFVLQSNSMTLRMIFVLLSVAAVGMAWWWLLKVF